MWSWARRRWCWAPPNVLAVFSNSPWKRPDLDTRRGEVRVCKAEVLDRFRQQLDYSTPIVNGVSALRLAVENRDEDSYYDHKPL